MSGGVIPDAGARPEVAPAAQPEAGDALSIAGGGRVETCRICFEEAPVGTLCEPCDCSGGSRYVHPDCLQAWILVPKRIQSFDAKGGDSVCEVCGAQWRGNWKLPQEREPGEQLDALRIRRALGAAFFRVAHNIPRPNDSRLLTEVGVHFQGPWDDMVRRLVKKQRKSQSGKKCAIC
eukprot:TRINITY_DN39824_c0_g1_i1.p1 TRINITY_DN39824_c0_g1~~TRINITY_DN39824_c0_g1_i1.p1  ORF type:complete len:177 (+),score=33.20 TRINITY_DN39824_c0_g1_i1:83-613(+)